MLPINRKDELASRANYYYNWARELIDGESDIFDEFEEINESQVKRYFYYLKDGEKKRQYVLKKYDFDDPCLDSFDLGYVEVLEQRMLNFCKTQLKSQDRYISIEEDMNAQNYDDGLHQIFDDEDDDDD